jgi:hypothetical protein
MDPATGKEVGRIPYLSAVNGVAFSPDGAYLAVTSSRSLNFWALAEIQQIRSEDLIAGACLHLYENLSTTQWEQFFGREEYEPLCKALPTP